MAITFSGSETVKRVDRLHEVPVGEQRRHDGGDDADEHATEQRDADGRDEEQEQVGGEGQLLTAGSEDGRERRQADNDEDPGRDAPSQ